MSNFNVWEYRKGFRLRSGKMVYGIVAMVCYTFGYVNFYVGRMLK